MATRIEVAAPVHSVFERWARIEDFPDFMVQVDRIDLIEDGHIRLTTTVEGFTSEWDAEIVELHPNESLAWRSLDGSDNGGRVEFRARGADRTEVTLFLEIDDVRFVHHRADAAQVSEAIALEDLARFRALVEGENSGDQAEAVALV